MPHHYKDLKAQKSAFAGCLQRSLCWCTKCAANSALCKNIMLLKLLLFNFLIKVMKLCAFRLEKPASFRVRMSHLIPWKWLGGAMPPLPYPVSGRHGSTSNHHTTSSSLSLVLPALYRKLWDTHMNPKLEWLTIWKKIWLRISTTKMTTAFWMNGPTLGLAPQKMSL